MVGQQIGRYRIDKEIGRGGMGVVYKGTQVTLDRTVAIKMLASHLADADASARFQREALTLAKLAHPNIIHIYDVEELQGSQFIIMEYVDGGSLGDTLQKTPVLTPQRVVEVMAPVLSGLAAAHKKGIIHRDIKPDNILFSETGRPKVTDFGIAHMRGAHSKTRTGVMLGTPYYMSPEQARGQKVTPAADIYASGVLMYEALTGRVPFTAEDAVSVALMHVQAEPEAIESLRPEVPTALCEVVRRAMAKDPADRFGSAAEMEDALLAGGWAPRMSGSGAAITASVAPSTAGGGETSPPSRVAGLGVSLGGLSEGVSRLGQSTGGLVAATGSMLRRPGWKGMPMAFWLGAAAIAAVALVGGVQAMSSGGSGTVVPAAQGEVGRADIPLDAGPGEGRRRRPTEALRPETQARALTPEESRSLADGSGQQSTVDQETTQGEVTRQSTERRGPVITPPDDDVEPEEPEDKPPLTPEDRVDDNAWQSAAATEIRAVIARQGTALETENRSLFLRDVHPEMKAEAARVYDQALSTATGFDIETSNVRIDFISRTEAEVSYSVRLTLVDRRSGDSGSASDEEQWYMVFEGGRWWLMEWDDS